MATINNNFDPTLGGSTRTKYRCSMDSLPMLRLHPENITEDNLPSIGETAADMFLMDLAIGDQFISSSYYIDLKSGIDVTPETLGQQLVEPAKRYERTLRENWEEKRIRKGVFDPNPKGRAALGAAFLEVADPITPKVTFGDTEALMSGHFEAWEKHFLQKRPKLINKMYMSFSNRKRPCQPLTLRALLPHWRLKKLHHT